MISEGSQRAGRPCAGRQYAEGRQRSRWWRRALGLALVVPWLAACAHGSGHAVSPSHASLLATCRGLIAEGRYDEAEHRLRAIAPSAEPGAAMGGDQAAADAARRRIRTGNEYPMKPLLMRQLARDAAATPR